jgi:tetratricopeptide (TPR) repeat protein
MLKSMLKFQKNWQKNYVITRIPDLILILFCALLLYSCAARPSQRVPPRSDLADPLRGTDLTATHDFQKAYISYTQGDQERARGRYLNITKKTPDYYPAYLGMAYTYLAEDNVEYAEAYIGKALEVNPDYAQAHFVLANILEVQHNYAAALERLKEVERINPQFPDLAQAQNVIKLKVTEQYLERGRQLADTDPDEALKYLKSAHDMAPEVAQIPADIANILIMQDNCQEAVPYLKIASDKNPEDTAVQLTLATCLFNMHEYQQAKIIYERLAVQLPNNPNIKQSLDEIKKRMFVQNLPMEYQSIPQTTEMTRAQLAAYLVVNLENLQKYTSENQQIVVDIIQHWAQIYIQKVVSLGIMDVFPNRTFQPNQPVTKLELAKAASRIMEIMEMSGRKRFPVDSQVMIPDIPPGHMHFAIVAKPVGARVITLDTDGRFHAFRRVTGAEAMSVVNQLKALLEP